MLHYLWVAIIGLVVGALAKLIMPGKDPGGIWITMLIGIAGSFLGTWVGRLDRLVPGRRVGRLHHVADRGTDSAGDLPLLQAKDSVVGTYFAGKPGGVGDISQRRNYGPLRRASLPLREDALSAIL